MIAVNKIIGLRAAEDGSGNAFGSYHLRFIFLGIQLAFCAVNYFNFLPVDVSTRLLTIGIWASISWGWLLFYEIRHNPPMLIMPMIFYIFKSMVVSGWSNIHLMFLLKYDMAPDFVGNIVALKYLHAGAIFVMFEETLLLIGYYLIAWWLSLRDPRPWIISGEIDDDKLSLMIKRFVGLVVFMMLISAALGNLRIGTLFENLVRYGLLIAAMIIAAWFNYSPGHPQKRILAIIVLSLVQLGLVISGNSKQSLIIVLLPLACYFIVRMRGRWRDLLHLRYLLFAVVIFAYVVMFSFPAISYRRSERSKYDIEVSSRDIIKYVIEANTPGTLANEELWAIDGTGYGYVLSRNNLTIPAAFALQDVDNSGYTGMRFFNEGLVALIPRIFWPDKPLISMGAEMDSYLRTGIFYNTSGSSTCLGFAGNSYIQGGIWLMILTTVLLGCVLAVCFNYICRMWYNPLAIMVYFSICVECLRQFESFFDGGLSFVIEIVLLLLAAAIDPLLRKRIWHENESGKL